MFYNFFSLFNIKKNRILFISYYGSMYGCNPKYIYKELMNDKDVETIWVYNSTHKDLNNSLVCSPGSFLYYYYLATSKVIVSNFRMESTFNKRREQYYVQTWHSSLRLKKIEKDAEKSLSEKYLTMAKNDSKQIDLLLSGSSDSENIFKKSFWYQGEIDRCGTPRNDIFFQENNHLKAEIKSTLKLDKDVKILLYAPTFRKNNSLESYNLDYKKLKKVLEENFNSKWVVAIRLHPHLLNLSSSFSGDGIINVTEYPDIQELLFVSDMLITDYSALMFDYLNANKPCFLYVNDLEDYNNNERDFYYELNELPFPVAKNQEILHESIIKFDVDNYIKDIKLFCNKIGHYEEGKASKEVVFRIKEYLNK